MSNTLTDKYRSIEDQEKQIAEALRETNQRAQALQSDILRIAGAKMILQQLIQEESATTTDSVASTATLTVVPDPVEDEAKE